MSVQVSYKKQLTLYLMLILVFLVVIEGAQKTYDFITLSDCSFADKELFANTDFFVKLDICYSYNDIEYDSTSSPNLLLVPNQKSNFFNINSDGIRGPEIEEKNDDTYRIILLGGSTAFGSITSSDEYTIPGTLQTIFLQNNFESVEVINGGIGSASSISELYNVKNQLLKFQPDMIIMYDGWNDVNMRYRFYADMTLEEFSSNTWEKNIQLRNEKDSTLKIGKFLNSIQYRTGLNMAKFINDLISTDNKLTSDIIKTKSTDTKSSELEYISAYMTRNWKDVCKLGLENDFETILLLQPMITTGDRILHADEKKIFSSRSEKQKEDLEYIGNLSFQSDELFPCIHFFDIRDTFNSYDETLIYFDHGHMFDNGNAIVAKEIFDNISSIVQKDIEKLQ